MGSWFATEFGEGATQGTIKRYGNQFLAELIGAGRDDATIEGYFQRVFEHFGGVEGVIRAAATATTQFSDKQGNLLLSLEETSEEISEIRGKLSRYADTSNSTIRELNELAEQHGKVNEEIITYNDLVAGAIQLGTAFNEGVDANQIAADLLAERFSAVAESSMSAGEAVDMLTGRITDQSLTIEEAVIELNRLRAAAGQAQLSLADFTLDPDRVIAQVRVITGSLIDLDQFTESLKQGLRQALQNEVALDFEAGVRAAIGEALFRGLIGAVTTLAGAEFLGPLLDQVNRLITQFVTGNLDADAFSSGVDTRVGQLRYRDPPARRKLCRPGRGLGAAPGALWLGRTRAGRGGRKCRHDC